MNLNYDLADPTQTLPYIVMTEEQLAGSRNLAGLEFGDMLVDPDSWSKSALPACQQNYLQPQSPILWDADSNATPSPASSHFPSPSLYDSVPGDFAEFDFLNALPEYQNFPIPSDFAWQESPHVPGAYFPGICQNPVYPTSSSDPGSYLGFMDSSVLSLSPAFEDTYSSMIMEPLPTTSSVLFAPIPIMGAPYYGTTCVQPNSCRRQTPPTFPPQPPPSSVNGEISHTPIPESPPQPKHSRKNTSHTRPRKAKEARLKIRCDHPTCQSYFSRNRDLQRHRLIHTGAQPFQCLHCGQTFNRRDSLRRHMKNIHSAS